MTYTEWRDELKSNLLSVSDSERRRVLEYYAEAYADRREAGFSEVRIIEEFGAPYDAAHRILSELADGPERKESGADAPCMMPGQGSELIDVAAAEETPPVSEDKPEEPPASEPQKAGRKKSRGRKALIIIASVFGGLFLAAFVYFLIGLGVNDWRVVTDYEMREYTCEADITALNVDGTVGNIKVELYDGDKAYVKYPTSKRFFVTVEEKEGVLKVKGPENSFPFWGIYNMPDTVIMLPEGRRYDLKLTVSAGKMSLADGAFDECVFRVSAGTLELGSITCKTADINVSAGDIKAESIACTDLKVKISAGDVVGNSVTADSVDINVSAGSVKLGLSGKKEEYTVFVDKSAGSCNVGDQAGTTSKTVRVHISAGSVEFGFEK